MATVVLDCPHCSTRCVTIDISGSCASSNKVWSFVGFCRRCHLGISLAVDAIQMQMHFGISDLERLVASSQDLTPAAKILEIWPHYPEPSVPQGLPPDAERAFREAETNRAAKQNESAAMMYRKALERGVKRLHGFENALDEKSATLAGVVKQLGKENKLTPDIAEWADHVRFLGNDGAHEENPPTDGEIDDLANLTRMALVYLFEMPERVALLRERRSGKVSLQER